MPALASVRSLTEAHGQSMPSQASGPASLSGRRLTMSGGSPGNQQAWISQSPTTLTAQGLPTTASVLELLELEPASGVGVVSPAHASKQVTKQETEKECTIDHVTI